MIIAASGAGTLRASGAYTYDGVGNIKSIGSNYYEAVIDAGRSIAFGSFACVTVTPFACGIWFTSPFGW